MTQQYSYIVLRYIHDVVTAESVNIAVLMFARDSKFLKISRIGPIQRIKCLFPNFERTSLKKAYESITASVIATERRLKTDLFADFTRVDDIAFSILDGSDGSLQWSAVAGGITDDLEGTFARLENRYVFHYAPKKEPDRRTDEEIWRPVKQLLQERNLNLEFEQKQVIGSSDEITFKKAWKNGVWHAYEPVSFDLSDEDRIKDKARRWRGHLDAVADGSHANLELNFFVGKPQDSRLSDAYKIALEILRKSRFNPEIFEERQLNDFVEKIEHDLQTHDVE